MLNKTCRVLDRILTVVFFIWLIHRVVASEPPSPPAGGILNERTRQLLDAKLDARRQNNRNYPPTHLYLAFIHGFLSSHAEAFGLANDPNSFVHRLDTCLKEYLPPESTIVVASLNHTSRNLLTSVVTQTAHEITTQVGNQKRIKVLIGHSMGGVIAADLLSSNEIDVAIAIDTPFYGLDQHVYTLPAIVVAVVLYAIYGMIVGIYSAIFAHPILGRLPHVPLAVLIIAWGTFHLNRHGSLQEAWQLLVEVYLFIFEILFGTTLDSRLNKLDTAQSRIPWIVANSTLAQGSHFFVHVPGNLRPCTELQVLDYRNDFPIETHTNMFLGNDIIDLTVLKILEKLCDL